MRKLTLEEFKEFLANHFGFGITHEVAEMYYKMYVIGRQSTRW